MAHHRHPPTRRAPPPHMCPHIHFPRASAVSPGACSVSRRCNLKRTCQGVTHRPSWQHPLTRHTAPPAHPPPSKAKLTTAISPIPTPFTTPYPSLPCYETPRELHRGRHVWVGGIRVCAHRRHPPTAQRPPTRPCITHSMFTPPSPPVFPWVCYMHKHAGSCIRKAQARGGGGGVRLGAPGGTRPPTHPGPCTHLTQ